MRLVITFLSTKALDKRVKSSIAQYYKALYSDVNEFSFDYKDRKYHEYDIDLIGIMLDENNLQNELDTMALQNICICKKLGIMVDVIISSDDTEREVLIYEKDHNDISSFGLFITKRIIPNIEYKRKIYDYYVFQNLDYTSFGVYC